MKARPYTKKEKTTLATQMGKAGVRFNSGVNIKTLEKYNQAIASGNFKKIKALETEHGAANLINPFVGYHYLFFPFFKDNYARFAPLGVAIKKGNFAVVEHLVSQMPTEQKLDMLRTEHKTGETNTAYYLPLREAANTHNPIVLTYLITCLPKEERCNMAEILGDRIPATSSTPQQDKVTLSKAITLSCTISRSQAARITTGRLMCTAKDVFNSAPFNQLPSELWQKITGEIYLGPLTPEISKEAIGKVNTDHKTACNTEKKLLWVQYVRDSILPSGSQKPDTYKRIKGADGKDSFVPSK